MPPASEPTASAPRVPSWLYWTVLGVILIVIVLSGFDWVGAEDRVRRAGALSTFANAVAIAVLFLPRVVRLPRALEGFLVLGAFALICFAVVERWRTGSPLLAGLLMFLGLALIGAFLLRRAEDGPPRQGREPGSPSNIP